MDSYFLITDTDYRDYYHQYYPGWNILSEKFNNDKTIYWTSGGFTIIKRDCINHFYRDGYLIHPVQFPHNASLVKIDDRYRVDILFLEKSYELDDPETYKILQIPYPTLHECVVRHNLPLAKKAMEFQDIHADREVALKVSCARGYILIVKMLLDRGADLHIDHDEPFILSCKYGRTDIVKLLTEAGADIHTDKEWGFQCAAENGHIEIVEFLISQNVNIRERENYALRWSRANGHGAIITLLEKMLA